MKLTFLFVFVIGLTGVFASTYAQETKLNVQLKNAPIKEVLKQIENQSEFSFAYDNRMINVERKLDADFQNAGIDQILGSIFNQDEVKYFIFDRHIVLVKNDQDKDNTVLTIRQELVIKGQVTDEKGELLIGANVVVKGTTRGVVTDMNGNYQITVPDENTVLVFSYVGYVTREITVGSQTVIDVVLNSEITALEELVVIGYGTQRKADVSGAVSTVRIADMQRITTSVSSVALQGQVAGVNVAQQNAGPGFGADIRIRGIGTLNNHFPLVIVDGVPSEINAVDPKDIESVNILKDAASAAIYGSRAANGVILINTNRGKAVGANQTRVTYRTYFSASKREKKFGLIDNAADFVSVVKQAANNSGTLMPAFVTQWESDPSQFGNTDWEDAVFRTAYQQKHDLSISRSGEDFNFYISGGFKDEQGIRLESDDIQHNLRVNSDFKIGKRLKIGESFGYTQNKGDNYESSYIFWALIQANPLQMIYDPTTPSGYGKSLYGMGVKTYANLVAELEMQDSKYKNQNMLASAFAELEILKNLKYKLQISQNNWRIYGYKFLPTYYTDDRVYRDMNQVSEKSGTGIHFVLENTLTYNLTTGNHDFVALAGYSQEDVTYHWFSGSGSNTPSNTIKNLGAVTEGLATDGGDDENKLLSIFGRLSYVYDDRYIFQTNIRRDGSSRFPEKNRWGWFPSVSLGWRVSNESFFQSIKPVMNELKIRASYGVLGMQEVGNYTYIPTIMTDNSRFTNYPFGLGPSQPIMIGARVVSFPSVDLKWETTKTTNIGIDMAFLENRLMIESDYYIKSVSDILYQVQIPLSAGSEESPPVNSASIDNKGFEIMAGWRKYEGDFKYDVNLSFATNTNEVTKLGKIGNESIVGGSLYWALNDATRTEVGTELGEYYLYKTDGLFQSQTDINQYVGPTGDPIMPDAAPGDLKIVDKNNDGAITVADKFFMGSGLPKAELGLSGNVSYKRFDFHLFIYSVLGSKKLNGGKWLSYRTDDYHGYHQDLLDAWTTQNTNTDIPRVTTDPTSFAVLETDRWLENSSYLRIKHVEIGYSLDQTLLNRIRINSARIYIGGDNLLTFTKYTGWDPGITGGGDSFASGVDRFPYPVARQYLIGLEVNF